MQRPRSYQNLQRGSHKTPAYRQAVRTVLTLTTAALCCLWLYSAFKLSQKTQQVIDRQQRTTTQTDPGVHSKQSGAALHDYLPHVVWWFAPFLSGGGYSSEANSFVLGLLRSGYVRQGMLWLTQHGDAVNDDVIAGLSPPDRRDLRSMMEQSDYDFARDAIVVCHSEPGSGVVHAGAWALPEPLFMTTLCPPERQSLYKIGRTMFETDRLSPHHVERCNKMDEVWVPTEFHRKVFMDSGVAAEKLQVIGEAVEVDFFDPTRHSAASLSRAVPVFGPRTGPNGKLFVLLSVFKWEARKGWDVLLKAFLTEFTAQDDVALYLKTMPYHSESDFGSQMRQWAKQELKIAGSNMAALPRVYVISSHIPQSKLPSLYKAADAFVLPSRGEGWGRPHVEAMSMGLPVIATNWSGPTAFLHESNGYLLKIDKLVPLPDDSPFKGHMWAEPSVAHLRQLLRHVWQHPEEAAAKGAEARRSMTQNYTPQVLARQIAERLQAIANMLPQSSL